MVTTKVYRIKEGICSKCNNKAAITIESTKEKLLLCPKHYLEKEGEREIEHDLISIENTKDYEFYSPELAKEIGKTFPETAKKYGRILRKIVQKQEKRK